MAERRRTMQKEIVRQIVKEMKNHPSADAIYSLVNKSHPNISRATIFRILNQLADDGVIAKISNPKAADRYDYRLEEHSHLYCQGCGGVFDIEVKWDAEWKGRITNDYGCLIHKYHLMFEGLCPRCVSSDSEIPKTKE